MKEVYVIIDNETNSAITGLRLSKRDTLAEIKDMNRMHATRTVAAILLMKSPKRANKHIVAKMAQSMADGRYRMDTRPVS